MAGVILTAASALKSGVTKYQVTWVSDVAGTVGGSVFTVKMGTILSVEFIPGVGPTQPDNLYDLDCLDANGVSVFENGAGATIGANLSNAITQHFSPVDGQSSVSVYRRWFYGGPLQLTVSNAGDTNSGVGNIYMVDGVV